MTETFVATLRLRLARDLAARDQLLQVLKLTRAAIVIRRADLRRALALLAAGKKRQGAGRK